MNKGTNEGKKAERMIEWFFCKVMSERERHNDEWKTKSEWANEWMVNNETKEWTDEATNNCEEAGMGIRVDNLINEWDANGMEYKNAWK